MKFGNLLRYQSAADAVERQAGEEVKVRHHILCLYIFIGAVLSAENAKTYFKQ